MPDFAGIAGVPLESVSSLSSFICSGVLFPSAIERIAASASSYRRRPRYDGSRGGRPKEPRDPQGCLESRKGAVLEYTIRFLVGGVVVSAFALLGDILRPKSFAGLFGAAPSVALATLSLTLLKEGGQYAALEGRMGGIACACSGLRRRSPPSRFAQPRSAG